MLNLFKKLLNIWSLPRIVSLGACDMINFLWVNFQLNLNPVVTSWSRTLNLGTSTRLSARTTFNEQQRNGCGNVFSLKIESHMHTLTQSLLISMWSPNVILIGCLRRLERVLRFRSVCETMEGYRRLFNGVGKLYISFQLYCWARL